MCQSSAKIESDVQDMHTKKGVKRFFSNVLHFRGALYVALIMGAFMMVAYCCRLLGAHIKIRIVISTAKELDCRPHICFRDTDKLKI